MEEPKEPAVGVEAPFSFPPYRRSHLRSGTYRNLVRLISLCYGDTPLATAPPIIPLLQTPDDGSNRGGPCGDDARELDGSVVPDNGEPANMQVPEGRVVDGGFEDRVLQDKVFSDTQMGIDEIEQIMGIEEGEDLLNQNDLMVNRSMEGTGFQDGEIARGQILMTELENIMKGNEDCDKSSNCLTMSLDQNQGDNGIGVSMNNQEGHNDHPPVMEESRKVGQPQVDMEGVNQKIIEAFGFSPDKSLTFEVSKLSEKVENHSSLLMTNIMHEKIEIQQKEMELEKFGCSNYRMSSPGQMVEDGELEEGEVFGDIQLVSESIDTLLDDAVVSEKKVEEKQVSVGTFDDNRLHCNEQSTGNNKDSEFSYFTTSVARTASRVTEGKLEGSERDQMVFELGRMHRKEGSGKILKQSGSEKQVIKSKQKQDAGVCNKKRQSPCPADRKEKKKKNKRKKRAEKNRQLGVKRLKLQTFLKPKPVTYCHHYLKGRCYEGEKCKFSHDTVPLTKSQPCSHFARHSCMKGNDCPFDHQLSKYPCISYTTKGFCGRGDDCLFSHKMSPEGDVSTLPKACELLMKPSLQGDSDMRLNISRASHKNVNASSCSGGAFSQKGKKQIVAETPTKTPDLACKGVNSPFVSKSSMAESSKIIQGSSSQKMNEEGRVGVRSNQSSLAVNSPFASKPSLAQSSKFSQGSSSLKINESGRLLIQANQSESGSIQNMNDSPKRKPEVVPRGINFLAFGKSSVEDSTSKVGLALNKGDGYKQHPSENKGNGGKHSNQTTQSTSSTDQKGTHLAQLPLGINLISFGKPDNSGSNAQASLPSNSGNVNNGSLQNSNYAAYKQHNSSAIANKLPVSPQTSGQSSEFLAQKNTPNSSQKAHSTLAVAKMFDNVKGKSVNESQHLSDKQYNSNANPWKMPASTYTTCQYSEKMAHKITTNSAQKALMSTLAFAAKFESGMKKNQSADSTGLTSESRDSRIGEGSKTDSAKISKLLDILSSVGSKTKQT